MSCKKIKRVTAPGHGASLVDEELDARSTLAVQKTARGKTKNIQDPTLGADLTKKILKSAVAQLEEGDDGPKQTVLHFQKPEEQEDLEEEEAVEIDFETQDEESRDLFALFQSGVGEIAHHVSKTLQKTQHQANPEVQEVYRQLGGVLKLYKSGKLPKAVNALASQQIPDWLELLDMSQPENWSANAVKAVTQVFAQSASDGKLEKYYYEVLLEYIREKLETMRKLPAVLFQALFAAARRPKCFIKGILIPLSQEPQCTMKEARVISTILTKIRLPRDHANAFIIKLCSSEVTVTRTIFLARMINKGQALAIQAIDAIIAYFLAFQGIDEPQPVLWHRAVLDFAKKYGKDVTEEQREALAVLLEKHKHDKITPEIIATFKAIPPREEVYTEQSYVPTFD